MYFTIVFIFLSLDMFDLGINSFYGPKYEGILNSAKEYFSNFPTHLPSEKLDLPQKKDFFSDFNSPVSLLYLAGN